MVLGNRTQGMTIKDKGLTVKSAAGSAAALTVLSKGVNIRQGGMTNKANGMTVNGGLTIWQGGMDGSTLTINAGGLMVRSPGGVTISTKGVLLNYVPGGTPRCPSYPYLSSSSPYLSLSSPYLCPYVPLCARGHAKVPILSLSVLI